jgi:hypothetical protein
MRGTGSPKLPLGPYGHPEFGLTQTSRELGVQIILPWPIGEIFLDTGRLRWRFLTASKVVAALGMSSYDWDLSGGCYPPMTKTSPSHHQSQHDSGDPMGREGTPALAAGPARPALSQPPPSPIGWAAKGIGAKADGERRGVRASAALHPFGSGRLIASQADCARPI